MPRQRSAGSVARRMRSSDALLEECLLSLRDGSAPFPP